MLQLFEAGGWRGVGEPVREPGGGGGHSVDERGRQPSEPSAQADDAQAAQCPQRIGRRLDSWHPMYVRSTF